MDYNALIDIDYQVQGKLWIDRVSTFRGGLPYHLEGTFHNGAFNAGVKMGLAADNPLGLGPFIMMDFVDGVTLNDFLKDLKAERLTRLTREDITRRDHPNTTEQLVHQPDSVTGPNGAKKSYVAFKTLQALVPEMINPKYDRGNKDDFTVVGILFGSAPWWLQDRPVNDQWDYDFRDDNGTPPEVATRYFHYLEIYKRVLKEEEAKMPGYEEKELSNLVQWSQDSGAMWLHMLMSSGFNDTYSFPWTQLCPQLGEADWARREKEFEGDADELEAFAAKKVRGLDEYDTALEKRQVEKELMDSGKMTKEEFLAMQESPTPEYVILLAHRT
ncbi:hypothetical protein B0H63DRAFT_534811 [Podospora didyma]|uniref:Uncharacterized protein n=1 Tax=Podospora didyma TaxID=330526 RepID=A0AAE0N2Q1_9PEZI|nr:hypothetical protein B0H63DRAFT_534811 [Podospora didyma]